MLCPVCKAARSTSVELEDGLKAVACETCRGHWLSQQNYTSWRRRHSTSFPANTYSEVDFNVEDMKAAKLCPDCGRILLKFKVGHGLDFTIDHCAACGGVWLDANEWQALRARNLHDEIHKIFSTEWQTKVRRDTMAGQIDEMYGRRLGAEVYARAKEIREWIQGQAHRQALLAFIADDDPYKI